jgi:hypothetical protein
MAWGIGQFPVLLNAVMNLKNINYLSSSVITSFSRRTLLHGNVPLQLVSNFDSL